MRGGGRLPGGRAAFTAAVRKAVTGREAVAAAAATPRRLVALTYDDGPNPHNTPALLELLAAHEARATFFVIGSRIRGREQILRSTVSAGHEIGNHTFSHVRPRLHGVGALRAELARTQQLVEAETATRCTLLRPPFGKGVRRFVRAGRPLGLRTVLWSVDPQDWADVSADEVAARTLAAVTPGAIVLLHDSGPHRPNVVGGTEQILRRLGADGYEFVTVSELLAASTG
jgi:peptidoglycan-N-acetylglucosamine deacetylase